MCRQPLTVRNTVRLCWEGFEANVVQETTSQIMVSKLWSPKHFNDHSSGTLSLLKSRLPWARFWALKFEPQSSKLKVCPWTTRLLCTFNDKALTEYFYSSIRQTLIHGSCPTLHVLRASKLPHKLFTGWWVLFNLFNLNRSGLPASPGNFSDLPARQWLITVWVFMTACLSLYEDYKRVRS